MKAKASMFLVLAAIGAFVATGALTANAGTTGGHFSLEQSLTMHASQLGAPGANEYYDPNLGTGVTCETATATAKVAGSSVESITFDEFNFVECHPTIGGTATVDMNGCDLLATIGENPSTTDQTVHLQCPAGKEVTLTVDPPIVGTCTIHIPPQTSKGGARYTTGTLEGNHDLTAHVSITEITNNKTETGFGCFETAGHNKDGELSATVTAAVAESGFGVTATGPNGEE